MTTDDAAKSGLVLPFWLRPNAPKRWIEKIHEYRDADGTMRFARVRWRFADGKKDVTYRRPMSSAKDWGHPKLFQGHDSNPWIPEAPRDAGEYLYRLPQLYDALLVDAPEVAWTEGESDADSVALYCPELPVTAHHGGAGKVTPGQLDWFRGYTGRVWVIADMDDPGAYCAVKRLDGLRALEVEAVALGPAVGKDVRDHLESGLGWADLVRLDEAEIRCRAREATPASFRRAGYKAEEWAQWLEAVENWKPQVQPRLRSLESRAGWSRGAQKRW